MKLKIFILILLVAALFQVPTSLLAFKKKVAQSGMTYLSISTSARLSAMGDASTAAVEGLDGAYYNPAVLADLKGFAGALNQVNWLVDTRLYSLVGAGSLGRWGTLALDLVYMDYGKFVGTKPVDTGVDPHGFIFTGDFSVQDFSGGLSYAYRMSDRFAFGFKTKFVHEDLGEAAIRTIIQTDTVDVKKNWALDHWGLDFGTIYNTGFKSLTFAMSLRNFSTDMKYWYEEFQLPMVLRMGLCMNVAELFSPADKNFKVNLSVDALHANDFLERIHYGTEIIFLEQYALRGGYQLNHDVETFAFGLGVKLDLAGVTTQIDYAYTNATYFKDISRFSIQFSF